MVQILIVGAYLYVSRFQGTGNKDLQPSGKIMVEHVHRRADLNPRNAPFFSLQRFFSS